MATRLPKNEIINNQQLRRRKTEADLMWDKITEKYQADLAIHNSLRCRMRYVLDKTRHKLFVEPATF
ncbi:hypothetical protein [Spartinivicinus poritis]|uniref:Uncharacterized protein n=1 Tax=Spartinivicinus poritis TaxID=2994640 RepID=A0ABT5UET6_9GAMM|nr:hypothetical protein [Spartinivicinus sp. A2-2]MDE1464822.1 hypothetical protein [Spartinivicinus sp. A2-2]